MDRSFDYLSAEQIARGIKSGDFTAVEISEHAIARQEKLEKFLNAFAEKTPDLAMAAARATDRAYADKRETGPLAGVPISIKDLIDVQDVPTRFGSRLFENNIATSDAPAVARIKAHGGAIIGKSTTTEFGAKAGSSSSPLTGMTRNAWNLQKTAGGSSAGAATSVAAGITPLALATDGGGSSRIPPAFCGVFGLKPQFGRIPIYPTGATPTLSHIGIISRKVRDAALLLDSISGYDSRDPHSVPTSGSDFYNACNRKPGKLRMAWSPTLGYARLDPEIHDITTKAVLKFQDLHCDVEMVEDVFEKDPIHIFTAEFYAGAGFKMRKFMEDCSDALDPIVLDSLKPAVRQTLTDYHAAVVARYGLREHVHRLFENYDLLITPTTPVAAFDISLDTPPQFPDLDPSSWIFYTYPFNLTGNPAASIPCGFTKDRLPVGLQIVSPAYREDLLLSACAGLEEALGLSNLYPPLDDK